MSALSSFRAVTSMEEHQKIAFHGNTVTVTVTVTVTEYIILQKMIIDVTPLINPITR